MNKQIKKKAAKGRSDTNRRTGKSARDQQVHVFISYARDDYIIAKAIYDVLTDVNPERVNCFLDTAKIGIGDDWQRVLLERLDQAKWLVCIYTGEQSEFCGYEIGIFSARNKITLNRRTASTARIACLHDVTKLPEVFNPYRHVLVAPVENSEQNSGVANETELVQFLDEFYNSENLRSARDLNIQDQERRKNQIFAGAKQIAEAFRNARNKDAIEETFTQPRLELSIRSQDAPSLDSVPADAEVSADGVTLALFGLVLPQLAAATGRGALIKTTWGRIREVQAPTGKRILWMEKIDRDVCDAARGEALKSFEVTFQSGKNIYRPILARHTLHGDGSRTFYILLVETIPRKFLGHSVTSLLLAGLVQASRFRFAYLEEWDKYQHSRFGEEVRDADFLINCTQLRYDLERIEHEAAEYGLLDRKALVDAYGESRRAIAESFGETWEAEKGALLKQLPDPKGPMVSRSETKNAILKFFKAMAIENARFIVATIDAYHEEILAQIKGEDGGLDFS
jgi:TIR domain